MEYKQVIIIRNDLKLPKGKMCSQAAHAAVEAAFKADKEIVKHWRHFGSKKIVLKVKDKAELYRYAQEAKDLGLPTAIITDAGKTVIAPGTVTCCGIGPDEESRVDNVIKNLQMM
jgi:peptidyl-tRNA hydrolase, PTH2 family